MQTYNVTPVKFHSMQTFMPSVVQTDSNFQTNLIIVLQTFVPSFMQTHTNYMPIKFHSMQTLMPSVVQTLLQTFMQTSMIF